MKRILTTILTLPFLFCISSNAQQIKGKVIDGTTSEPLPFANIVIIDDTPAESLAGTVTDMDGNFALSSQAGQETIRISYLGYLTKDTVVTSNIIHTINLMPDANLLDEVVIKGIRKTIRMENGGLAMDVANSPLANIGTANDVLEKMPFVVKDGDALTVLGKGTPLIYINNRLVRNTNELERLSSSTIKKVTVITNPGPEYDATVSSVIRIEATRPPGEGFGGELYGRMNAKTRVSADASINLNYRINNLDLFGSYWFYDYKTDVENILTRSLTTDNQTTHIYGDGDEEHNSQTHYLEGGFNYAFNDKHSIGAKYNYERSPDDKAILFLPSLIHIDGQRADEFQTDGIFLSNSKSHLLNAYYTGDLASWMKVQFDFDYTSGDSFSNQISLTERTEEETVNTRSIQDYDLVAGKLTLTSPVWGNELRYGAEFSRTTNEQNYIVDENDGAEDLRSNTNLSKQKLFAAFANYSRGFGKWSFQLGLRFENVGFDYYENGNHVKEQSRVYRNLFPTATIDYQGEKVQMMLGYRATISRPGYYQLRNTIQFDDPYTYETGNPYLKPTRVDDISYSLLWRQLKLMASYKIYDNAMLFVPQQYENRDIILFRPENIKKSQNATISAYYSPRFGIWEPVAGIGVMKDFLKYGTPEMKYEKPYLFYSFQNTLRLPLGFVFMADLQGNSRGHSRMLYHYDNIRVNLRLTKTFLNDNLILNVRGTDIFRNYRQKWMIETPNSFSQADKYLDTQSLVFTVRYKFNTTRSKYKGESVSEEERQRL